MTAAETIELAQGSVDQIQKGIVKVQDKLEQADALVQVVENVVEEVRGSRRKLICAGVALGCIVGGVAVFVIVKKKKARTNTDGDDN